MMETRQGAESGGHPGSAGGLGHLADAPYLNFGEVADAVRDIYAREWLNFWTRMRRVGHAFPALLVSVEGPAPYAGPGRFFFVDESEVREINAGEAGDICAGRRPAGGSGWLRRARFRFEEGGRRFVLSERAGKALDLGHSRHRVLRDAAGRLRFEEADIESVRGNYSRWKR